MSSIKVILNYVALISGFLFVLNYARADEEEPFHRESRAFQSVDGTDVLISYQLVQNDETGSSAENLLIKARTPQSDHCQAPARALLVTDCDHLNIHNIETVNLSATSPEPPCQYTSQVHVPLSLQAQDEGCRQQVAFVINGVWLENPENGLNNFDLEAL